MTLGQKGLDRCRLKINIIKDFESLPILSLKLLGRIEVKLMNIESCCKLFRYSLCRLFYNQELWEA